MKIRAQKISFNWPQAKYFIGLLLLILYSCNKESLIDQKAVEGTWMGGAYELDRDEYQPFTKILEFTRDGLYIEKRVGENKPDTFEYAFNAFSLEIDTFEYKVYDIKREGDELFWGRRFTRHYRKVHPATGLDIIQVEKWLTQQNWRLGDRFFQFSKGGHFFESTPTESHCRQYCYELESYRGHLFLNKKGNQVDCKPYPQFREQIIEASETELKVIRWQEDGFQTVSYQVTTEAIPCEANVPFQLCNRYLYMNFPPHRYYYNGTVYQGGLYVINKIFKKRYQAPTQSIENGLIRVRFIVNCEGKAGMFEMLELDNNYKEKRFDAGVSQQIFEIVQELQNWIPGKDKGQNIDTYKYLTFKIKDGAITEIFP